MRHPYFTRSAEWIAKIFQNDGSAKAKRKQPRLRLHLERLEDRLPPSAVILGQQAGAPNSLVFHGDEAGTGFSQNETVLTPSNVSSSLGQVWQSPVLDGAVYATPLYMDSLTILGSGNAANHAGDGVQSSSFQGKTLGVVFAATGGGSVYAIAAQDTNGPTGIAPGTILWKTHLGNPYAGVDGNSIGVLSTPVIDAASGRIYVTASVTDYLSSPSIPNHGGNNFEVFALNLKDGSLVSGWPLIFTQSLLDSINQNKLAGSNVAVAFSSGGADQRGALKLNADGSTLYVDFACYGSSNGGWMTTVATGLSNGVANGQTPAIVSAYSSIDTTATVADGGMWGAGGPVIDAFGNVFVSTGDSPAGTGNPVGTWGNSVLEWGPGQTLTLTGAYSPWNYQNQDTIDSDMGGGSPIVISLPAGSSTTTDLLATGGKQGNGYLLDAGNNLNNPTPVATNSPAQYPASLTQRPPGGLQPDQDPSLYDTSSSGIRTYWSSQYQPQPGPLAIFGPYNESSASGNTAKARDTPATFTGPDGSQYVIWAGASKAGIGSSTPVAPSLVVTKVVHSAGQPAYLQIVAQNTAVMSNPGANLITGNGTANEIDWIVDEGQQRSDGTTSYSDGSPVLYAYNALTMQPLWSSAYEELDVPGGKYNSLAVARGDVFIGTNRIQAFGLTNHTIIDDSVTGTGANQFNYVGPGWQHITGSSTMGTFQGTVSTDRTQGDYVTMSFTGSAIQVYANEVSGYGTATFTVDGNNLKTVTLQPPNSSPNGQGAGDALVYTVTGLGAGSHMLKILNNAANNTISVDRVQITPLAGTNASLSISGTDGGIKPGAGGIVPYTINYNNAGSIFASTGVNASGVVITDTVPANTTADLANSTPGWTLVSGNGGAGSVYSFSVGALNAGVTGSVVFTVDLNSSIPNGTTNITDNFTIADAASDTASAMRTTPIPPPSETKLIFSQEPPANGGSGIALSPAVTVTAEDQFGNTYTADSSSTVTLTLNGGVFHGGSNTATATVSNGVATFSNLVIDASGTYTLTATDGALASTNSSSFFIANTSKLAFTQQPSQTFAGNAISPSVTVAVENQGGTIITTDSSTVILTISQGSFANGSTSIAAQTVSGIATFSNLIINATGSYSLRATDGMLSAAQSNTFNVVAQPTQLAFAQEPNNTFAGEAVNPTVTVALEDQFGNLATSDTSNVTLSLSSGTFFGGATSVTAAAVNGIVSFNDLVITSPGSYTLTASRSGLPSVTSFLFTIGTHVLTKIDDNNANNTGSTPQVVYSSVSDWVQSPTSAPNNFDGTLTSDSVGGDNATVTFNGTLITLYALESPDAGSAQIFIDGNSPAQINLASSTAMIAPVFTSPLLSAGTHTIVVKVVNGPVAIDDFVVGPATPTLAWATPAPLVYGTALNLTQLDAYVSDFASFPGTFTYSPASGAVLPVGQNQPLNVTFVPQDSTDYDTANATTLITVTQATPVITWTGPQTNMTYGQALSSAQLNATATVNGVTVPGTFVYTPGIGTVPPTGQNFPLSLTFTPTDTRDYVAVNAQSDVDVDPATPVITWNTPSDISDGTPLSSTQLDATANVPGTFVYTPAAGTVLPVGLNQSLGVFFTPSDTTDYNVVGSSVNINVDYGPPAKLAFISQPRGGPSGSTLFPAVTVAVEDAAGSVLPNNTSTVTLTLSSGAFVGGRTTASVAAVNGIATFSSLAIANNGTFTFTATDGNLASVVSNQFTVGAQAFVGFNSGSAEFTSPFATNLQGSPGGANLVWNSTAGINDQAGGASGGGVEVTGGTDETAVYTPVTFNLSDGAVHTMSIFVTAAGGLNVNDREQIGFVGTSTSGLNGGFSFLSARIYGDDSIQIQTGNGSGTQSVTLNDQTAAAGGSIKTGDWLQLVFTTQEVASGNFNGSMSLLDYGPTGTASPTLIIAPVPYSVTGLTSIGTGSSVYAAFRTATGGEFTTPLNFDNFSVDQPPARLAYYSQPQTGTAGSSLAPFVAAVQDINGNLVVGDTSAVTLTLSHGTFANGQSTVTANAVDGIATFNNLVINAGGSYILRATDSNPNLDPGFAPFTINAAPTITAQPVSAAFGYGTTATFTAAAAGPPSPTVQWLQSTDGGKTFNPIAGATSTTLSLSNINLGQNNNQFEASFTNSLGTVTSSPATLTVLTAAPAVTTQPASQSIAAGSTVSFTAAASGYPAPTIQWYVNHNDANGFSPISGANSTTLTLNNVSAAQNNFRYEAYFSNVYGGALSNVVTLTVNTPPSITTQPLNQVVNAGSSASFTAAAGGSPPPTVQWQVSTDSGRTWTNVSGATSTTLNLNNVTPGMFGNEYQAIFSNVAGAASTTAAMLTVNVSTSTTLAANPTGPVNQGMPITFTATVSGSPSVGTVTFYAGPGLTNPIGSAVNVNGGSATSISTATLAVGMDTVTAVYSGGNGFLSSQGTTTVNVVDPPPPITINSIAINAGTAPIVAAAETGSVVTITTDGPHHFSAGDPVVIANVGSGYDGSYSVASVSTFSFTINFGAVVGLPTVNNSGVAVDAAKTGGLLVNGATSLSSQRSMVDSVVYKFSQSVTLAAGAFSISPTGSNPGTTPAIAFATPDGGLTWVLTFSGAGVTGNSIANGEYKILLNSTAVAAVAGNASMAASDTEAFYRLFGDTVGNGHYRVSAPDRNVFNGAFGSAMSQPGFLPYLDWDNNGVINAVERNGFNGDASTIFSGFTATI